MTGISHRLTAALADRYRLERELGAGGMATVYLADDLKHDRKVAIKVLRPELAAVLGAERFVQEIKVTANLQHPHILPLFDSGQATVPPLSEVEGGTGGEVFLYYVMPYVVGESLATRLQREKQLSVQESVEITVQVASALAYAHAHGIVHRDIKPDNILLSSGHAVVADFGIARALDAAGGDRLTATGVAIGTLAYMSPEQSSGESDVDGRSDIYSLASVLYELLAGEPPFAGSTPGAIIARRLSTPAPPVRALRGAVPEALDAALRHAMQLHPADRPATAEQFGQTLRAAVTSGSDEGREAPRAEARPHPSALRRRVALGVTGVVAAAALGWWSLGGGTGTSDLDAGLIAVMPFRVGGDPAIAYLRESMLDLLHARLSGASGPRTLEPRTTLSAWRRTVDDDFDDLSEDESRDLAARLGAGRVLLGGAVAVPNELTLSGTLLQVADGAVLANGSVVGAPDSVAVLVNRLTAQLLALEAGEGRERLEGLATTSLDALQDYLAGRRAYRRGDYFEAVELYERALARDSGFVQAAFGLLATNAWTGTVISVAGFEVLPTVWRLRDRLSDRDVALVRGLPFVGPNYPGPSTYREVIAHAEDAAAAAQDSPEDWLLLGQLLSKYGAVSEVRDWPTRAAAALERAIALDSSFVLAIEERLYTAMQMGDGAATRRYAALLEGSVLSGFTDDAMLWAAARSLGDTAQAMRWRNRVDESARINFIQKLVKIPLHSVRFGLPLDDARWANATLLRGTTRQEWSAADLGVAALWFAEGRTLPALPLAEAGAESVARLFEVAFVEAPFRPFVREVITPALTADYPYNAWLARGARGAPWPPLEHCFAELFRVSEGDTSRTRRAIRRLREFAAQDPPPVTRAEWDVVDFRICPLLLETLLEGTPYGSGGRALDSLGAILRTGPRWLNLGPPVAPVVAANFTVARLREAQGDIVGALAAIRRREKYYYPQYLWTLPAFLRQEGRLAALAGDTTGALRAYDHYLTLREDPDPPFRPQRDSVVAERAALERRTDSR